MTAEETLAALAILKIEWATEEVTEERAALWHRTLIDLPYLAVEAAVIWWVAEEKWFPRPGQLRERAEILLYDNYMPRDSFAERVGLHLSVRTKLALGDSLALPEAG